MKMRWQGWIFMWVLGVLAATTSPLRAQDAPKQPPAAAPELRCTLEPAEAPRGGRIKVQGEAFGATPLVRIAGQVAKMLHRGTNEASVQVARDSNGGEVTLTAGGKTVGCGQLTIIGKN